ncbi:TonB-dependent hemoglobin/transferrin/lactoferrin family receptor [Herbaspirillum sp. LeCh32-8]|uniref:TonB-dependent hemoglobin/transferrin/lactoferrin family receptor n=1 Tax=Herbaspirillum sp. LeCh32-8 TaxID=2821356 RepID=UPI001AEADE48|nr:TonB-dependent hemoglobin/transferrin/lactoferrin family receptor [Herbaspirillum sp. LeCh32-8]MBP0599085.1 TonB-dependent hemoglobin/transferrin/lactoferrin family receptor [Herbaspirillum sp. LeCh32-8]
MLLALQQWPCANAFAQTANDSINLAQASDSETSKATAGKRLQDVVVTANRSGSTDLDHAAATVSVITSEDIEEHNARDIKDALRYEPGVEVRRNVYRMSGITGASATTGRGGNEGITIRGLDGNRVLMLEDGIAMPRAFSQGVASVGRGAYTDTELYQRIEVLRGPASSLYGSDGMTGAVNFITKDPQDLLKVFGKSTYFSFKPSYDSGDRSYGGTASAAWGGEQWQGMLILNARHGHEADNKGSNNVTGSARTTPDPMSYTNRSALGKLVFKPNGLDTFKLTLENTEQRDSGDSLSALGSGITSYQTSSKAKSNRVVLGYEHVDPEHPWLQKFKANVYYRDADTNQYTFEGGTTTSPARPRFREVWYSDQVVGGNLLAESNFGPQWWRHKLVYGLDLSVSTLKVNANGTGWTTCTGTQYCEYFPKTEYTSLGAYVQDEMRTGALTTIAGLRYDAYDLKPQASAKYDAQAVASGQPAASSKDSAFSPRLAFLYEVTPAFIPYIQYARGFRSPSPQEVNSFFNNTVYKQISNPDLKPETSNTFELGLRGKLPAGEGALRYSAAAYKGSYRNFIDLVTVGGNLTVANPTIFQYRNAYKAEIHGFEGRVDWQMDNGVSVKGGFAWTKGTTTNNGVEQGLESVAPLSVVTGVRYEPTKVWFVQTDMVYNAAKKKGDIPTSTNFVSPSFFVMDLSGGYRFNKNMILYAGIRNLFDKKYWSWTDIRGLSLADSAVNKDAYTEPGRSFNVSMKFEY